MSNEYLENDIVIVDAARSIVGSASGSLEELSAAQLGHPVVETLLARLEKKSSKFSRDQLPQMIVGNCIGAGIGQNLPRQVAQLCGMNDIESAFSVNEMCGSGMESIFLGIQSLKLDEYPMVLVGGIEDPSASPYLITQKQLIEWQEKTVEEIQTLVVKSDMHDALWCKMYDVHTIVHAENTTKEWAEKRKLDPDALKQEIDKYAALSHERALKAIDAGVLKDEIVLIPETSGKDELPAKKNLKIMAKRKGTQFTPDGLYLSNHNSPPLANAAAFLMIMKYGKAKEFGFEPMARITAYARAGIEPPKFLLAPVSAVKKVLAETGTQISDYELLEMNTAFGSQMIFNKVELELDMEKVNIYGDCIAYGHPIGAGGARITTTLLYAMKNLGKKRGMASICLGGGNGLAMAVERL